MITLLKKVKQFVLDLVFPKKCLKCGLEGSYLCYQCFNKLVINDKSYCIFCQQSTAQNQVCETCQSFSSLRNVWVASDYNDEIVQALIHNLKYNYIEDIADILNRIILKYLAEKKVFSQHIFNEDNTIIVPVPLHKKRLLQRGFNQSDLIAQKICNHCKFTFVDILNRNRNTISQVSLKRKQRQINIKDAFSINQREKIDRNKKVILIDDVITTGSTLNECARVLKENGFNQIFGLVIAHRQD